MRADRGRIPEMDRRTARGRRRAVPRAALKGRASRITVTATHRRVVMPATRRNPSRARTGNQEAGRILKRSMLRDRVRPESADLVKGRRRSPATVLRMQKVSTRSRRLPASGRNDRRARTTTSMKCSRKAMPMPRRSDVRCRCPAVSEVATATEGRPAIAAAPAPNTRTTGNRTATRPAARMPAIRATAAARKGTKASADVGSSRPRAPAVKRKATRHPREK